MIENECKTPYGCLTFIFHENIFMIKWTSGFFPCGDINISPDIFWYVWYKSEDCFSWKVNITHLWLPLSLPLLYGHTPYVMNKNSLPPTPPLSPSSPNRLRGGGHHETHLGNSYWFLEITVNRIVKNKLFRTNKCP